MRILIVEGDRQIADFLCNSLRAKGCSITLMSDGETGVIHALKGGNDVVVSGLMLPKMDGISLVRILRAQGRSTPVILLASADEIERCMEGLEAGADDYLLKPLAVAELMARLRSALRRNLRGKPPTLAVANLVFDIARNEARRGGRRIFLSIRETRLLEYLLSAEGRVVSRREIYTSVWGYDFDPGTNLVDVYIRRLREKIDLGEDVPLIHTVRGTGYVLREEA